MKDFLSSLKIRAKLLAAFGSILLLSVLLIFFSISSINTILLHKATNEEVDQLKLYLETLELSVKEFLHEDYKSDEFLKSKTSRSAESFRESYRPARSIISDIEGLKLSATDKAITRSLIATLDSLSSDFEKLVKLLERRGFRDYGSEGALRQAIHQVENSGFNFDKVAMLTLRRHEKDFFLRKDLRYQDEFNTGISAFRGQLEADPTLAGLITPIDNYSREFNNVVEIEKQIGLKEQEGIRGKIRNRFAKIRPQLENFSVALIERNESEILRTKIVLGVLFVVQIIAGLLMAIVYSNLLTRAIKEIRDGMQQLAAGVFPDKLLVKTSEEIGQTKIAFNQFVERLRAATSFASKIGTETGIVQYDEKFADDVLADSLIQAQVKLAEAESRQRKINWANQGIASFNDILKKEVDDIEVLSDKIISQLVNTMHANQGALYLLKRDSGEEYLERIATYAYGKKKFDQHRIEVGEGLVGQSVFEGSTLYLKEIPKDFVRITSGLGEATPKNILIVPLKTRLMVMGVIEMASFDLWETYEIEFIERIAENIASILSNQQTALETKRLLEESQQRADVLIQQVEEMRQNSEELQATQEEMKRQRKVLEVEIIALKAELNEARQKNLSFL